ncbi:MAG: protease SohB [Legionellales bacterium]|nr:MAG: protease SohB [Legionellales bacterium]
MGQFLFEYGMFVAKAITVTIAIVATFGTILALLSKGKLKSNSDIEISKLNEKYAQIKQLMQRKLLTKQQYKNLTKATKKARQELTGNIFVVNFQGDLKATAAVQRLRDVVTAILCVATSKDAVLVTIESQGGLVHSYGLAAAQLARIRSQNIHLTVAIDLVAASGGYLMAAVANKIIAAPFAIVGSIGVVAQLPNFHKLLHKHNIEIEQHTAGKYKRTLTMLGKNTDTQRDKFKEDLEATHVLFKQFVSTYRSQVNIETVATGEHWFASQAIDLQLIDKIMTSDDYLLDKSKNTNIFLVKSKTKEKLTDKISAALFKLRAAIC